MFILPRLYFGNLPNSTFKKLNFPRSKDYESISEIIKKIFKNFESNNSLPLLVVGPKKISICYDVFLIIFKFFAQDFFDTLYNIDRRLYKLCNSIKNIDEFNDNLHNDKENKGYLNSFIRKIDFVQGLGENSIIFDNFIFDSLSFLIKYENKYNKLSDSSIFFSWYLLSFLNKRITLNNEMYKNENKIINSAQNSIDSENILFEKIKFDSFKKNLFHLIILDVKIYSFLGYFSKIPSLIILSKEEEKELEIFSNNKWAEEKFLKNFIEKKFNKKLIEEVNEVFFSENVEVNFIKNNKHLFDDKNNTVKIIDIVNGELHNYNKHSVEKIIKLGNEFPLHHYINSDLLFKLIQ